MITATEETTGLSVWAYLDLLVLVKLLNGSTEIAALPESPTLQELTDRGLVHTIAGLAIVTVEGWEVVR